MAVCRRCNREMLTAASCDVAETIVIAGREYKRVRFGYEHGALRVDVGYRCGDCGVRPGGLHHVHCDQERCPRCGGQFISCACFMAGEYEPSE